MPLWLALLIAGMILVIGVAIDCFVHIRRRAALEAKHASNLEALRKFGMERLIEVPPPLAMVKRDPGPEV